MFTIHLSVVPFEANLRKQFSGRRLALSSLVPLTTQPVSLRIKLLVGFSVVFSLVFAGAFYWFYTFTTDKVITRLRSDMRSTLAGTAKGMDVDQVLALYQEGVPNASGFSDDNRYQRILSWFETVHAVEPQSWLYVYVVGDANTNRRVGKPAVLPGKPEIIYLVDLWSRRDSSKAAGFLQGDVAGIAARRALIGQMHESEMYRDRWGTWISASMPLGPVQDGVVPVLGLDVDADYVYQLQSAIRGRVLIAFVITYSVFFALIYALSGVLTRQLTALTRSAQQIGGGDYSVDLAAAKPTWFPDELGALAQVFQTMVDSIRVRERLIRDSKRTEDEMRLALQEERELNELKSRFVAMVSHELRTPLTIVRTSLELLERYGHLAPEEKRKEYFQRSRASLENMNHLIEEVLLIGKAEAGKLKFEPTRVDVQAFCLNLVEEMRMSIGGSHDIQFISEGNCYQGWVDTKLLRSILSNLLSNAIKYSPAGKPVQICLTCAEQNLALKIVDHGIGIPAEDQPRLFELFHRASNVATIRGTGLGLAIVKQCVAQHLGEISFTSREGEGTTFWVNLPLRRVQ